MPFGVDQACIIFYREVIFSGGLYRNSFRIVSDTSWTGVSSLIGGDMKAKIRLEIFFYSPGNH